MSKTGVLRVFRPQPCTARVHQIFDVSDADVGKVLRILLSEKDLRMSMKNDGRWLGRPPFELSADYFRVIECKAFAPSISCFSGSDCPDDAAIFATHATHFRYLGVRATSGNSDAIA